MTAEYNKMCMSRVLRYKAITANSKDCLRAAKYLRLYAVLTIHSRMKQQFLIISYPCSFALSLCPTHNKQTNKQTTYTTAYLLV